MKTFWKRRDQKGFTLIERMIVIAIIGILYISDPDNILAPPGKAA